MDKRVKNIAEQARHKEYITSVNIKPITLTEKRLDRLRKKHGFFGQTSPISTKCVIYCVYGIKDNYKSPLYVGQTTRTAYERLNNEIGVAFQGYSLTPISKFIREKGRYNVGTFILQEVKNTDHLDYFERKWIHILESQQKNKYSGPMNINQETKPLTKKARYKKDQDGTT
eukprot:Phypoly_transcript_21222.p1 GENE.Phypoly_transcript_21222~~Phypoly_transcript_21222.p1  ORF type:complete len:171 (+),score=3.62 Phypoly_transcript_21222:124-636(+)